MEGATSVLTKKEANTLANAQKDIPTVGTSSARAWSLLRRAKPFYLKTKAATYFVDRGGYAIKTPRTGEPRVRARTLLNPAKEPPAKLPSPKREEPARKTRRLRPS